MLLPHFLWLTSRFNTFWPHFHFSDASSSSTNPRSTRLPLLIGMIVKPTNVFKVDSGSHKIFVSAGDGLVENKQKITTWVLGKALLLWRLDLPPKALLFTETCLSADTTCHNSSRWAWLGCWKEKLLIRLGVLRLLLILALSHLDRLQGLVFKELSVRCLRCCVFAWGTTPPHPTTTTTSSSQLHPSELVLVRHLSGRNNAAPANLCATDRPKQTKAKLTFCHSYCSERERVGCQGGKVLVYIADLADISMHSRCPRRTWQPKVKLDTVRK